MMQGGGDVLLGGLPVSAAWRSSPSLAFAQHGAGCRTQTTRYSLVHGCYSLSPAGGAAVGKQGGGYVVGASAEAFRMQATDLGRYLLYGRDARLPRRRRRLDRARGRAQRRLRLDRARGRRCVHDRQHLRRPRARSRRERRTRRGRRRAMRRALTSPSPRAARITPRSTSTLMGGPATGSPAYGEVAGFVEGHMHGMALRVPRRQGALRQAVGPLRRSVRAARLCRSRGGGRLRRGARERPLQGIRPLPRPGRVAELRRTGQTRGR